MLPAYADPYLESWSSIILLNVHGTLKKPLPGSDTIDYKEQGTGFIVSPNGLVLTAGHNIPNADIFDEDGFQIEGYFPAKDADALSAVDPPVRLTAIKAKQLPYDVALLQITDLTSVKPFLRLCDGYKKEGRPEFLVLGYPGGDRRLTVIGGPLSSGAGVASNLIVQIPINPGNSGAPLFNEMGMVFGIAIGERTVAGERMQLSGVAVPIAKAISTLGDEAKPLIGISYDPDCQKTLTPRITSAITEQVFIQRDAPDTSKFGGIFGGGFNTPRPGRGSTISKVPNGYKVVGTGQIKFDNAAINGNASVSNDGRLLTIGGADIGVASYTVNSTVPVFLEQIGDIEKAPEAQNRTFPLSRTLDDHGLTVTTKEFSDKIPAPDGFLFKKIVKVDYESLNNSPSKGIEVHVLEDGSALAINYTLQSGPIYDRWRGWIDALITTIVISK
ncbi:serine protease [Pseudomonas sp. NA-150]|uniref:S1 family peptidase n=1 Tax=Pseudomonas sp. NA-150 TaxID=3367525 RepID=UPI0037C8773C